MRKITSIVALILLVFSSTFAQEPNKLTSAEIHDQIKKLNFLGSVLYVAAHPDDENTTLISYLSNHVHARTAYLSLTRGDGGQNLIGPELREQLGVLRTQELLAARGVDGGEQFFTRANDFGFSKHPDETLAIWNKDEVLSDVVWAIRKFRPDVIINRFNHKNPGTTHGHHTSSAMLGLEAFDLSGDKTKYTEQLQHYDTWQPTRILFNTSWWFYGSRENFEKADKSNLINVDAGVYYPSKGLSNLEISALSRSQHKCQGFGRLGSRGEHKEYLEFLKGEFPKNNDLFYGIDTSWNRVSGGKAIGEILNNIEKNFNFSDPSVHVADLAKAYQLIQQIDDQHWKIQKSKEIIAIIEACSGLFFEAIANVDSANIGDVLPVRFEAINRSKANIVLFPGDHHKEAAPASQKLTYNKSFKYDLEIPLNKIHQSTTPYWLDKTGTLGMYNVDDKKMIGLPETPQPYAYKFVVQVEGVNIPFVKKVIYKYADPAVGEIYEPFHVLPEATVSISENMYIFNNNSKKEVKVTVRSGKENLTGSVSLKSPTGWEISPKSQNFSLNEKGGTQQFSFTITPPNNQSEGDIIPQVTVNGTTFDKKLVEINYDHIPKQSLLLPAKAKVVKLDIKKKGSLIGYIKGSGDVTPESLAHIGYRVEEIAVESITATSIAKYDAIVIGIRAYNLLESIKHKQDTLFDYVKNGGNMIVQYNTRHRLKTQQLAPFKLKLSRDRVTDEHAAVNFLAPQHQVLNSPNKITKKDFEGWVQERGLYFPNEWGEEFTPILSMHDKDESAKMGSLLIAPYGKGYYVYTGLSFFREFPSGVSGAYRLFANLISLGN
ncbi:MAG: PIG-L family deacetylase [Flavobacteriaceae bacterium]|nr:PIG-L family deacetylase [Flavobacteriaceae bacterium]